MSSIIDKAFATEFNEAAKLYDDDKLEECIEKCKAILADNACPRYHRMKTLILLGNTLGDWGEANTCCIEADFLWRVVRRWHPVGDATIDAAMAELKESIVLLRGVLDEEKERPTDYDAEDVVLHRLEEHDKEVEEEQALHDAEFGEENAWDKMVDNMPEATADDPSTKERSSGSVVSHSGRKSIIVAQRTNVL